ncbi:PREDICTED: estrogen sulfotransferase-like isoform X1 [Acropora digitifera]|uniref:estrogen sulfotransferase-like isoform X1 n=1 Tax=Acropora digitifera TaxID=70779 RepID=UPI00077AC108|nr:PREDICTED: estrogen sulfotransferase-like isoform X1 [Acropora digitifera]
MAGTAYPVLQTRNGNWRSLAHYRIKGMNFPARDTNDPAKLEQFLSNFQTKSDDVFVVSYPKSGTTWTQEIVWQIHNEGKVSKEIIGRRVPYLEFVTVEYTEKPDFEALPSPRLIKTHLTADAIPKGSDESSRCKYIYISRNPKDISVSLFLFIKGMTGAENTMENAYNGPWEFFVDLFIEGDVPYSKWNDHVLSWWKHREDPNVLFLKYEEMQKDLPSHVRRIADFLQKPLSDEIIDRIAEQCTFKEMTRNPKTFKVTEGDDEIGLILRKGVVGDWKNYFTPEMNERFEKEVLAKLKGTGLAFEFEP